MGGGPPARVAALRRVPHIRRRAAVELAHWTYGAGGGAFFGLLPDGLRRRAWAGPVYGLLVRLGFEANIEKGYPREPWRFKRDLTDVCDKIRAVAAGDDQLTDLERVAVALEGVEIDPQDLPE